MSNYHPKRILFIEFVVWSSQSLDTCIVWVESRLRIHPHRCCSFSGAFKKMSCWQTEHVLHQTWLGDDASSVDTNDFTPVRSTVGICWDEDMESRWTKRVSRDWKQTSQVVGCSMTLPCRNDQEWNHLNKSELMEFEWIWCLLYHGVYLLLSIHLNLQIKGVQLTGQREASKSVFRGRIQVDRRQGCGRRRVIIGACARVFSI